VLEVIGRKEPMAACIGRVQRIILPEDLNEMHGAAPHSFHARNFSLFRVEATLSKFSPRIFDSPASPCSLQYPNAENKLN